MAKKKKKKNSVKNNTEVWSKDQYEEYLKGLYGMEYIAGYTDGGVPYGISNDDDYDLEFEGTDESKDSTDDIPF